MLILIPAFNPDESLPHLCKELSRAAVERGSHLELLIINDGSDPRHRHTFTRAQATIGVRVTVINLPENQGKGVALRAGFTWAQNHRPQHCVVTADADGQHLPADILSVGVATESYQLVNTSAIVLGVRTLEEKQDAHHHVPLRSRLGNAVTVGFFALATGRKVLDTQTGLRGFTSDVLEWAISVPGARYEYEFNTLLRATRTDIVLDQVPITKVYEPGNPTSHFRPVYDSLRIYSPLILFLAASFAGFVTDTVALLALAATGLPVILAVIGARLISGMVNFCINRWAMHDGGKRPATKSSILRYGILAFALLTANAALLEVLTWVGIHLLVAKILVELMLVPLSFAVQRRWIFSSASSVQSAPHQVAHRSQRQRRRATV